MQGSLPQDTMSCRGGIAPLRMVIICCYLVAVHARALPQLRPLSLIPPGAALQRRAERPMAARPSVSMGPSLTPNVLVPAGRREATSIPPWRRVARRVFSKILIAVTTLLVSAVFRMSRPALAATRRMQAPPEVEAAFRRETFDSARLRALGVNPDAIIDRKFMFSEKRHKLNEVQQEIFDYQDSDIESEDGRVLSLLAFAGASIFGANLALEGARKVERYVLLLPHWRSSRSLTPGSAPLTRQLDEVARSAGDAEGNRAHGHVRQPFRRRRGRDHRPHHGRDDEGGQNTICR